MYSNPWRVPIAIDDTRDIILGVGTMPGRLVVTGKHFPGNACCWQLHQGADVDWATYP
jgi:hypothetical protein